MPNSAQPTVQVDNAKIRITEWRFAAGAATGYHRHEYDYVVVPMTTGVLQMLGPDNKSSTANLVAGQSYFREAGVEHDVINTNTTEFVFVEVEIKG